MHVSNCAPGLVSNCAPDRAGLIVMTKLAHAAGNSKTAYCPQWAWQLQPLDSLSTPPFPIPGACVSSSSPQVCVTHPESKGKYIKIILALLQSSSTAVVYECAGTLVALSQAPTAIRAAANCYCQLLVSQSDNNVKLIVLVRSLGAGWSSWVDLCTLNRHWKGCVETMMWCLFRSLFYLNQTVPLRPYPFPQDRLAELKEKHRDVMRDVLLDVLRALAAPNTDIRRKTLDLALELIDPR